MYLAANKQVKKLTTWESRTIKLTPMQIRTFVLTVSPKQN
jgi:hypothetical protein